MAMPDWLIRTFREGDQARIREITVEGFDGVSVEQRIDRLCPGVAPMQWAERKWLDVAGDLVRDPEGCLVAEAGGDVVGYITTAVVPGRRQGRIPNLAVDSRYRGRGIGRALILAALDGFRRQGMRVARIETLADNAVGTHLYPELGFREVARQVHFAMPLDPC